MGGPDWLYFTLAGILGVLSLWLFYRGLFADRSRGRKRCPKCFYDLSAAPSNTCPECGRVIKKPRQFHKTHRYKGRTAIALLCFLLAGIAGLYPHVRMVGWTTYLPNSVLFRLLPTVESERDALWVEFERRVEMKTDVGGPYYYSPAELILDLSDGQKRLLARSCAKILQANRRQHLVVASLETICELGPAAEPAVTAIVEGLQRGAFVDEILAIDALGAIGEGAAPGVPFLIDWLAQGEEPRKWEFMRELQAVSALGEIGAPAKEAVPILRDGLRSQQSMTMSMCALALAQMGSAASEALPDLLALARDQSKGGAASAVFAVVCIAPESDEVQEVVLLAVGAEKTAVQRVGLEALAVMPALIPQAGRRLHEQLSSEEESRRAAAILGLRPLAPPYGAGVNELKEILANDESPIVRAEAAASLILMSRDGDQDAEAALDRLLESDGGLAAQTLRVLGWKPPEERADEAMQDTSKSP